MTVPLQIPTFVLFLFYMENSLCLEVVRFYFSATSSVKQTQGL